MLKRTDRHPASTQSLPERWLLVALCFLLAFPFGYFSPSARAARQEPDVAPSAATSPASQDKEQGETVFLDAEVAVPVDSLPPTEVRADDYALDENGRIPFNPSPTRAVWLSALCPGLGQIYNRRYWKLPIVIGGFMGLGYATNWNANMYSDYMQGYRDLLDNDPGTNSYMDFFPPTVKEEDLDSSWLERTFKSQKDYYRRNRDLCIICLVALYALCMLDAYVDAQLTHFDVSPSLSMDVAPTLLKSPDGEGRPSLGLNWAITF